MEVIVMVGQLILALAILVTLHEWGHFQAARSFGIKVEKFYLFFDAWGIKLFSFKKGDTEYGVGWLPLGGYVKIAGMIDESMDKEFLKNAPQPYEFRSKPAWQRLVVMIGGVTVNVILGVVIYTLVTWHYGVPYISMDKLTDGIVAYEIGNEVGFATGDKIVSINGVAPKRWSDVLNADIILNPNVVFEVDRNGKRVEIRLPDDFAATMTKEREEAFAKFIDFRAKTYISEDPKANNAEKIGLVKGDQIFSINGSQAIFYDQFKELLTSNAGKTIDLTVLRNGEEIALKASVDENGKIGVPIEFEDIKSVEKLNFGASFVHGASTAFGSVRNLMKAFGKIFTGKINAMDSLSGPIQIAKTFGPVWDWYKFWTLTGMLSMILAFMNILPIPALDGGHVFFLLIEMITGRPLKDRALEIAQMVGFSILIALMVFIFGNDIYQVFIK